MAADPGHAAALNNLGVLHLRAGDFAAAAGRFQSAVRLNPRAADPYYNLACLHALQGELARGLAFLQRAAELEPAVIEWSRKDPDLERLRGLPGFGFPGRKRAQAPDLRRGDRNKAGRKGLT